MFLYANFLNINIMVTKKVYLFILRYYYRNYSLQYFFRHILHIQYKYFKMISENISLLLPLIWQEIERHSVRYEKTLFSGDNSLIFSCDKALIFKF